MTTARVRFALREFEPKRSRKERQGEEQEAVQSEAAEEAQEQETAQGEAAEDAQDDAQEGRRPVIACDPGRPTREEFNTHRCTHWPFRAWCRHCVRGRGIASPHRTHTGENKEFREEGRVPTISLDHCFLGSEEEAASGNPFLILFDDHSESLFAVAVPTKEYQGWLADLVKAILDELGYAGVRIAIKNDNAQELIKLRSEVTARRAAPTVPLESPVAESKCNGAVEKAVRTWQGQFRTLKDHLEYEIGEELGPRSTIWTWCAWWAASLLNRVKVTTTGRTPYELYTGHKARVPVAAFGERILWRVPRARSGAGKYDSEWDDGIFLGVSGVEAIIGTADGVHRSRDIRRRPEGECWHKNAVIRCKTSFREYMCPEGGPQAEFEIPVVPRVAGDVPGVDFTSRARRMMLHPRDFERHGFTAGCPGCIHQQAGTQNRGGRHSEKCRERIEKSLLKTPEGRTRKERERLRQQQEFEKLIAEEDVQQAARSHEGPGTGEDPEPPGQPEPPRPPEASASRPSPEHEQDGYEPAPNPRNDSIDRAYP